jgi:hypothetical protein
MIVGFYRSKKNLLRVLFLASVFVLPGNTMRYIQAGQGVTRTHALQICNQLIKSLGSNPDAANITVSKKPITFNTLKKTFMFKQQSTGKGNAIMVKKWVENKFFWRCAVKFRHAMGAYAEIYIDSNNGEVLYVMDVDARFPKKWTPPGQVGDHQ